MLESTKEIIYQIICKTGGSLSCVGSGYILQDVLRDPEKRSKSIYHRIMVGLSTMDILFSFFFWILGSWPTPEETGWQWAVGNMTTCDIAAFLGMMGGIGSPLYTCALATFYLLQLKYNWPDRKMKAIEKWLHIVPWSISLVYCIILLITKGLGPYRGYCQIALPYPSGCNEPDSQVECIRDGNNSSAYWIFTAFFLLVCAIYVAVTMLVVYKHVRGIERKSLKYSFIARFGTENKKKTMKRSRRVMIQGILYCTVMVTLYAFYFVNSVSYLFNNEIHLVLHYFSIIILPLQGIFNMLIYLVPFFRKMLKTHRRRNGIGTTKSSVIAMQMMQPTNTSYIKKVRISLVTDIKVEEEEKKKIPVVQHTFHPESSTEEGNVERVNGHLHLHHDTIDNYEVDDDESSGEEFL